MCFVHWQNPGPPEVCWDVGSTEPSALGPGAALSRQRGPGPVEPGRGQQGQGPRRSRNAGTGATGGGTEGGAARPEEAGRCSPDSPPHGGGGWGLQRAPNPMLSSRADIGVPQAGRVTAASRGFPEQLAEQPLLNRRVELTPAGPETDTAQRRVPRPRRWSPPHPAAALGEVWPGGPQHGLLVPPPPPPCHFPAG